MYVGQWHTFHGPVIFFISWRLFDGLMLYWRYWFSVTQTLKWNYIYRSVTYISWFRDFVLYLEDYLMDKCHNGLLDACDAKIYQIKCILQVSDLYFMVQWFCLICWTNVVIGILVPCDAKIYLIKCMWVSDIHFMVHWFYQILKTIWWINIVLEILIQCDTNIELKLYM